MLRRGVQTRRIPHQRIGRRSFRLLGIPIAAGQFHMHQQHAHTDQSAPYSALGLDANADENAVRSAFRRLAFELHPDRNHRPEARDEFLRVREAYELLIDPQFRQRHEAEIIVDQMTRAADEATRSRPQPTPLGAHSHEVVPPPPPLLQLLGLVEEKALRATTIAVLGGAALIVLAGVLASLWLAIGSAILVALALAIWFSRGRASDLRLYAHGFTDSRWEEAGRIGWADVLRLDPDPPSGILDLELSDEVAGILTATKNAPRGVLVRQGGRVFYRLHLGDSFQHVVEMIAARTGLGVERTW